MSDGTSFSEDLTNCNRLALPTLECTFPVQSLTTTPFSLPWGSEVWATVAAINTYGYSAASNPGSGAVIITYADAPLNLREDYSQRIATGFTLVWDQVVSNGGSTVIDYRLTYDNAGADWVILENNILLETYDVTGLTAGSSYRFQVQARNSHGLSAYSEVLTLVAGFTPAQPAAPTTLVVLD
jgi:hypothetical protein